MLEMREGLRSQQFVKKLILLLVLAKISAAWDLKKGEIKSMFFPSICLTLFFGGLLETGVYHSHTKLIWVCQSLRHLLQDFTVSFHLRSCTVWAPETLPVLRVLKLHLIIASHCGIEQILIAWNSTCPNRGCQQLATCIARFQYLFLYLVRRDFELQNLVPEIINSV